MNTGSIRIVLIDEHLCFVESLAACIDFETDLCVVGTATNAEDALRLCLETAPDVAVFEVEAAGWATFDCVGELRSKLPQTKVLFLSTFVTEVLVTEALRLGARGYITKREPLGTVLQSIRQVAAGETCFSDEIREGLEFDPQRQSYSLRHKGQLSSLTPRQLEVLRFVASGNSVKEIARKLFVSQKSIDSHKYRVMQKLDLHDRVDLARYAIREGLVLP